MLISEAKKKVCPFAAKHCFCVANRCMAWVITKDIDKKFTDVCPDERYVRSDIEDYNIDSFYFFRKLPVEECLGYCALISNNM